MPLRLLPDLLRGVAMSARAWLLAGVLGALIGTSGCVAGDGGGAEEGLREEERHGAKILQCPLGCAEPPPCWYTSCAGSQCEIGTQVDGTDCVLANGEGGNCFTGECLACTGCDDGNECTFDACAATGCAHYPYAAQQSCAAGAGHCTINSYGSPDVGLCVANGMCLDRDPSSLLVAPVAVCSAGQTCGVYSGQCGSI